MPAERLELSLRQLHEWPDIEPRLVAIVTATVMPLWPARVLRVTDIGRTEAERVALEARTGQRVSRVHVHRLTDAEGVDRYWRAIDLAWDDVPRSSWSEIGRAVNAAWEYDPRRPDKECALWADHGTGPHLHLQVHPFTRRRVRAEE